MAQMQIRIDGLPPLLVTGLEIPPESGDTLDDWSGSVLFWRAANGVTLTAEEEAACRMRWKELEDAFAREVRDYQRAGPPF